MRIAISGASGLVGTAVCESLRERGDEVLRLVRQHGRQGVYWNATTRECDESKLDGVDAVIHLAGENIASGRWTKARKQKIRSSRVEGTSFLSDVLSQRSVKPRVLISASAVGFYGDRGDQLCNEAAGSGEGFLAEVCQQWESATAAASQAGIRVVNLRIGMVLSPKGGALAKMLLPFRLGVGGRLGSGRQYWSWIELDDLIGLIVHCIDDQSLSGPVNAVAPDAVTNSQFTAVLGSVLSRPTVIPMPAFAARLALGEMADELLLPSARVDPEKARRSNYKFRHPELESALRHLLNR